MDNKDKTIKELQIKIKGLMEVLSDRWEDEIQDEKGMLIYDRNEDSGILQKWKITHPDDGGWYGHIETFIKKNGDIHTHEEIIKRVRKRYKELKKINKYRCRICRQKVSYNNFNELFTSGRVENNESEKIFLKLYKVCNECKKEILENMTYERLKKCHIMKNNSFQIKTE